MENWNCTYTLWKYPKLVSTLWKLSIFLPQNVPHCWSFGIFLPYFFKLSQQIYGDFYKSFRNLPNFFREHARGTRAIFHLWSDFVACSRALWTTQPEKYYFPCKCTLFSFWCPLLFFIDFLVWHSFSSVT